MAVTYAPHPLLAAAGARHFEAAILPGENLDTYLRRLGIPLDRRPFAIEWRDRRVMPEELADIYPAAGDTVTVRGLVQRSDGGGSSNVLATVLTIAVLAFAPYAGVLVASSFASTQLGAAALYYATYGALVYGAGALVQRLTKPPEVAKNTVERNFAIMGSSNTARPMEPMTIIFGRVRHFPDVGAKEWYSQEGTDSYLHQTFNFGLSDLVLSDYEIGGTPISHFPGLSIEESGANGVLTRFPRNVDSVAGGALVADANRIWVQRTSAVDTTRLIVDIGGQMYRHATQPAGEIVALSGLIQIQYRLVGDSTWLDFFDAADYGLVNGGAAPVRESYTRPVDQGQYEVRVRWYAIYLGEPSSNPRNVFGHLPVGTDPPSGSGSPIGPANPADYVGNPVVNLIWTQLRCEQVDTADYTGQKRIGVMVRASGQLNGTIDRLSAISSARVPVWDGADWVIQESSNPAWQFRWYALGGKISGYDAWGGNLPLSRIDEETLIAWGAFCVANDLTCDFEWRSEGSVGDVLDIIAHCGRAVVTWQTGKLGVVWEAPGQPKVATVGMSNIVRDSFQIDYLTQRLADEIAVEFINPGLGWSLDTVRATVPGVTNPVRTTTIRMIGIISQERAGREVNLQAARQVYARKRIRWKMALEGLVINRGSIVELSHDLTQWGYSGRLVDGTTTTVHLDRKVPIDITQTNYLAMRHPDGLQQSYEIANPPASGDYDGLVLLDPLPVAPDDDIPMDFIWLFGPSPTPGYLVRVVDVAYAGAGEVSLQAVPEVADYYLHEDAAYTYVEPNAFGNRVPRIADVRLVEELRNLSGLTRLHIDWRVENAGRTRLRVETALGGLIYQAEQVTSYWQGDFEQGDNVIISLSPVSIANLANLVAEPYQTVHTILGLEAPPSDVQNLQAKLSAFGGALVWDQPGDLDLAGYEVREGMDWDTAESLGTVTDNRFELRLLTAGAHTYLVKAFDTLDIESQNPAAVTVTIANVAQLSVTGRFDAEQMILEWTKPQSDFAVADYEIRQGDDWASAAFVASAYTTRYAQRVDFSGTRRFLVAALDVAGNLGPAGAVDIIIQPPGQPALSQEIIDNNVLLRWQSAPATLPIALEEIRRGNDYDTADVLQTVKGSFSTFFENQKGTYTYWVTSIDTAGNRSAPRSVVAQVNQPPGYQLIFDHQSDFAGTRVNALITGAGDLLFPVNVSETYAEHFTGNGFASPQDQVDAGFARVILPSEDSASYEEEIDVGAVVPASMISLVLDVETLSGDVTVTPAISTRKLDTDPWDDHPDTLQVFASDFQFVKVHLDASAAGGDDLLTVKALQLKLDVKVQTETGTATANENDVDGTPVVFSRAFADITSITVSPRGTAPRYAVYDFADIPNPVGFAVYLYDAAGNRVSGDFSWTAEGY